MGGLASESFRVLALPQPGLGVDLGPGTAREDPDMPGKLTMKSLPSND